MKYSEVSDKIINAFYEVYNKLGEGFLEKVYENALLIELKKRDLFIENQIPINVYYDDHIVGNYIGDILVDNKILIELKAIKKISKNENIQLLNYLCATKYEVGLILNFGSKPEISRVVYDNQLKYYNNPEKNNFQFLIDDKSSEIINSFYNVYSILGYGFQNRVYKNAIQIELLKKGIQFHKDYNISIIYESKEIGEYQAPFFIDNMIVSILGNKTIDFADEQRMLNHLNATGIKSGIILNFGKKTEAKRKFLVTKHP